MPSPEPIPLIDKWFDTLLWILTPPGFPKPIANVLNSSLESTVDITFQIAYWYWLSQNP
jgi:hypothetical protein